jgi:hypothetical protein
LKIGQKWDKIILYIQAFCPTFVLKDRTKRVKCRTKVGQKLRDKSRTKVNVYEGQIIVLEGQKQDKTRTKHYLLLLLGYYYYS